MTADIFRIVIVDDEPLARSVVREFLKAHPDAVRGLIEGEVATNDYIAKNPLDAQKAAEDEIEKITQKRLSDAVVAGAWKNLDFTNDPGVPPARYDVRSKHSALFGGRDGYLYDRRQVLDDLRAFVCRERAGKASR